MSNDHEGGEEQDHSSRSRDDPWKTCDDSGKTCEEIKHRDSREEGESVTCIYWGVNRRERIGERRSESRWSRQEVREKVRSREDLSVS